MAEEAVLLDVVEDVRAYFEYLQHLGVASLTLERGAGGSRKPRMTGAAERQDAGEMAEGDSASVPRFQRHRPSPRLGGPREDSTKSPSVGHPLTDFGPNEVPTFVGQMFRDEGGSARLQAESLVVRPSKRGLLEELGKSIENCARCDRARHRTRVMVGSGNVDANLLLVGDVPDGAEDREGLPFLGEVGNLLDRILKTMLDLERSDVYLVNVIRCPHPSKTSASTEALSLCSMFLEEQIRIIAPQIIVALGEAAAQTLLKTQAPLASLRGKWYPLGDAVVIPTYHPAELMSNDSKKRAVRDDMRRVKARMALAADG